MREISRAATRSLLPRRLYRLTRVEGLPFGDRSLALGRMAQE